MGEDVKFMVFPALPSESHCEGWWAVQEVTTLDGQVLKPVLYAVCPKHEYADEIAHVLTTRRKRSRAAQAAHDRRNSRKGLDTA